MLDVGDASRIAAITYNCPCLVCASLAMKASRLPSGDQRGDEMSSRFQVSARRMPLAVSTRSSSCWLLSVFQSGVETITAMRLPSGEIRGSPRLTIFCRSVSWNAGVLAAARAGGGSANRQQAASAAYPMDFMAMLP